MATCAETLTPLVAECGGKDAMIVDADADADAALFGACYNAGQTCIGIERVYVTSEVADEFIERRIAHRLGGREEPVTTLGTSRLPAAGGPLAAARLGRRCPSRPP
jgi:acyl-CoA reductase-like NAD-dependent aldehyde dehydrogenase